MIYTLQDLSEFPYVLRTLFSNVGEKKTPNIYLCSVYDVYNTKEVTECFFQTGVQGADNAKSSLSKNCLFFIRKNN